MVAISFLAIALSLGAVTQAAPSPFLSTVRDNSISARANALEARQGNGNGNNGNGNGNNDANKNANANKGKWQSAVGDVVKSIGVSVANDASKAGKTSSVNTSVDKSIKKQLKSHDVKWNSKFEGWRSYKANGVNLNSWLEIENGNTANVIPAPYPDEWSWCGAVGIAACGPVLEKHYAEWFTTADIDNYLAYGINTLRIPTTYAAWLKVPGSNLYTGSQLVHLRTITNYAVSKGMHIVIGLHSLPGGTNWLDIGEAFTHIGWWYNATNLDYSLKVVDNVLAFIQTSINPNQFTLSPINEPCDDFSKFATPNTVSYPEGVNYLNTYMRAVYAKIQKVNKNIPLMITDSFMGASYWAPYYTQDMNVVFDSHFYFFAAAGVYSEYVSQITCGQAQASVISFPVFVGEFSLQSRYNNTLAGRREVYQSQVYAYSNYLAGGAFWGGKLDVPALVDGEGRQNDYWSLTNLIKDGVVLPGGVINSSFC